MRSTKTDTVTLEGVILPAGWGSSDEVVDLSLLTFDESDYLIDPVVVRDHGIADLLRRRVRLSAVVRHGRVIRIESIAIID